MILDASLLSAASRISAPQPTETPSLYTWCDREVFGITRLLEEYGLSKPYSDAIDPEVMRQAQERGVLVHYATAEYDQTGAAAISPELEGYVRAWGAFRRAENFFSMVAEHAVIDRLRGFCCTLDRLGAFGGSKTLSVLDIKTYDPRDKRNGDDTALWLQLAGQSAAARSFFNLDHFPRRAYVWLKPDGRYSYEPERRATFARHLRVVDAAATLHSWNNGRE